jgi:hypothetical protein
MDETPHRQPIPYGHDGLQPDRSDGCRNVGIGCFAALLVVAGMLAVGGVYLYNNFKRLTAETAVQAVRQGIRESELPAEQQTAIIQRVEELANDFRSGDLTMEEMFEIGQRIIESRAVIASGAEFVVRKEILDGAALDQDEQTHVDRLMDRLARGIVSEQLEFADFESVKDIILVRGEDDEYRLKEHLSREDVDEFIGALEALVDEADIPDEPFEIDLAAELDRIIENVRGGP